MLLPIAPETRLLQHYGQSSPEEPRPARDFQMDCPQPLPGAVATRPRRKYLRRQCGFQPGQGSSQLLVCAPQARVRTQTRVFSSPIVCLPPQAVAAPPISGFPVQAQSTDPPCTPLSWNQGFQVAPTSAVRGARSRPPEQRTCSWEWRRTVTQSHRLPRRTSSWPPDTLSIAPATKADPAERFLFAALLTSTQLPALRPECVDRSEHAAPVESSVHRPHRPTPHSGPERRLPSPTAKASQPADRRSRHKRCAAAHWSDSCRCGEDSFAAACPLQVSDR